MEGIPIRSEGELLRELQRLNRTGVINDEEFLALRKIIRGGSISPEFYRKFDRLFAGKSKSTAVGQEKNKGDAIRKAAPVKREERLYSMTEAMSELNLNLSASGAFDHSRAPLTCPACGLFEKLSAKGRLITSEADHAGVDTGLRFAKVNDAGWECPDCGHLLTGKECD
jgi:rubredoxin